MRRLPKKREKLKLSLALIFIFLAAAAVWILFDKEAVSPGAPVNDTKKTEAGETFDKSQYSLNNPGSTSVIVNKGRRLPSSYVPEGLRAPDISLRSSAAKPEMWLRDDAAAALEEMSKAAGEQGAKLRLTSGYRSYNTQTSVYNAEVNAYGKAQADKQSARPGHSEHQTGLAADLEPASGQCRLSQCFADTAEGIWLKAHAHEYGFIVRYVQGGDPVTGYMYEPWHMRFIGSALAPQVHSSGQTLEQFFALPLFPDYPKSIYQLTEGN